MSRNFTKVAPYLRILVPLAILIIIAVLSTSHVDWPGQGGGS